MPTLRRRMSPFALSIFILTFAGSAFAQPSASPPAPLSGQIVTQQPTAKALQDWRAGMARVPVAKPGCFTASHPSTEWHEVPCKAAPPIPFIPASGPSSPTVGNGNDVVTEVATGTISMAVGSFDRVIGVTSENGGKNGDVPNAFSLQLNSNTFTTSTCPSGQGVQCVGWQQFVYSNTSNKGALIQYWLLGSGFTCPSGWNPGAGGCFTDSLVVPVPQQDITNLANLSVAGQANVNGMDQIIVSTGGNLYVVQNPANMLDLSSRWTAAEFGVFGDGGGSRAIFNPGSTIVVRTSVNNGTPTPPSCIESFGGFTGEKNNLSFANPLTNPVKGTLPAVVFTISSTGTAPSPCAAATELLAAASTLVVDTHDFNDDGFSDILLQNTGGGIGMWLMGANATIQSALGVGSIANVWTVVGQRDLNGDGRADILFRANDGSIAEWLMNGATISSANGLGNPGTNWNIVGTGDFSGDGIGDILLSGPGNGVGIWFMNSSGAVASAVGVGALPNGWIVAGTGDFNGDGVWDILWYYQPSGAVAVWLMNSNGTINSAVGVGSLPNGWSIAGIGDFNGDGISDILLSGSGNAVGIWFMNNSGTIASAQGVGTMASGWTIVQTGDYNGDGKSDILWYQGSSGAIAAWLMNGTTAASVSIGSLPPSSWMLLTANSD